MSDLDSKVTLPKSILIDKVDLCRLLGVKAPTWGERVRKGLAPLPFTVMGGRSYYRVADVRYFLRKGVWHPRVQFKYSGRRAAETGEDGDE